MTDRPLADVVEGLILDHEYGPQRYGMHPTGQATWIRPLAEKITVAVTERAEERDRERYELGYRHGTLHGRWLTGAETGDPPPPSPEQQRRWEEGYHLGYDHGYLNGRHDMKQTLARLVADLPAELPPPPNIGLRTTPPVWQYANSQRLPDAAANIDDSMRWMQDRYRDIYRRYGISPFRVPASPPDPALLEHLERLEPTVGEAARERAREALNRYQQQQAGEVVERLSAVGYDQPSPAPPAADPAEPRTQPS